jgi:hypothetical protein
MRMRRRPGRGTGRRRGWVGTRSGRRMSQAMLDAGARTLWTPYARFDQRVAVAL